MLNTNQFRIIEYINANQFFLYNTTTGDGFEIKSEIDRSNLRLRYNDIFEVFPSRPIEKVSIRISGNCNMTCKHCYVYNTLSRTELAFSAIKNCIDDLKDLGLLAVHLTGGEPLLHREICKIIQFTNESKLFTSMDTNGLLLDLQTARNLQDSGLKKITISLDGFSDFSYREIRGRFDAFDTIRANLFEILNDNKILLQITINTVINCINISELPLIFEFLKDAKKIIVWNLSYSLIMGNARSNAKALIIQKEDAIRTIHELKTMAESTNVNIVIGRILGEFLSGEVAKKCCGSGGEFERYIAINTDGSVLPCPSIQTTSFGNIYTDKIFDIWNSKLLNAFKNFSIIQESDGQCNRCFNKCTNMQLINYACRCTISGKKLADEFPMCTIL